MSWGRDGRWLYISIKTSQDRMHAAVTRRIAVFSLFLWAKWATENEKKKPGRWKVVVACCIDIAVLLLLLFVSPGERERERERSGRCGSRRGVPQRSASETIRKKKNPRDDRRTHTYIFSKSTFCLVYYTFRTPGVSWESRVGFNPEPNGLFFFLVNWILRGLVW